MTEPASDNTHPLLQGLTPPQREAVLHTGGPMLVLAAAGSGKTRVISRRIAWLVHKGAAPWSILALTFTNKAAGEMRERVTDLLLGPPPPDMPADAPPRAVRGLTVTTFHALCARLMRRYAEQANLPGVKADFTIFPTADQLALLKRAVKDADLSTTNWPPRSVLSAISNAKNEMLTADQYAARANDFYHTTIARLYKAYEHGLHRAGAVDFDDLLLLVATMLRDNAEIRGACQDRWRHLLVDEYQDTNKVQFEIARLLAGEGRPADALAGMPGIEPDTAKTVGPDICVVGDPDQAIYGWRGADISNILDFETHFPGARTVKLGQNFRSTAPILGAADTLIKKNTRRKDKPLFTDKAGGERVSVVLCRDEHHEATLIADWFTRLHEGSTVPWREMAVFYRTNALSRVMEEAFRQARIPYVIARGTAFYEREEVRDALSYLRVVANQADDISLARIVNKPTRGLGKTSLDRIALLAEREDMPVFEALRRAPETGAAPGAVKSAARFVEMIDGLTGSGSFMGATVSGTLAELVARVIDESSLASHYRKVANASGSESDEERLDNLDELVSSARDFEAEFDPLSDPIAEDADPLDMDTPFDPDADAPAVPVPHLLAMLRAFLESVALVADADTVDPEQGAVTLMTLHAAKGLEFDAAAMIGLEEGLLPHSRAFESEPELEEERRLAFVGITRARKLLHITSARYRTVRGATERTIPSRFLTEVGTEHAHVSDQSDAYDDVDQTPREREFDRGAAVRGDLERVREQRRSGAASAADRAHEEYPEGCTVRHPQFGEGRVMRVMGGQHARAVVKFGSVGEKTLVLEYARLRRVL
ncbi:MAG: DNA helicase PcrA [Phycisphaeraceae bacterium]|nr:MAG: DNA helicase PcrA [Phycisphaeraceae bacterium]